MHSVCLCVLCTTKDSLPINFCSFSTKTVYGKVQRQLLATRSHDKSTKCGWKKNTATKNGRKNTHSLAHTHTHTRRTQNWFQSESFEWNKMCFRCRMEKCCTWFSECALVPAALWRVQASSNDFRRRKQNYFALFFWQTSSLRLVCVWAVSTPFILKSRTIQMCILISGSFPLKFFFDSFLAHSHLEITFGSHHHNAMHQRNVHCAIQKGAWSMCNGNALQNSTYPNSTTIRLFWTWFTFSFPMTFGIWLDRISEYSI